MITFYYENECSLVKTLRALRPFYVGRSGPSKSTIQRLVAKFETTGSVNNQPTPVRQRNARSVENIAAVCESVQEKPGQSIPRLAQELGLSQTSTWRILRRDLGQHSDKSLKDNPNIKRVPSRLAKTQVRNGDRPFLCPHCIKTFSRLGNLEHHIKKTHQAAQSDDECSYSIGQVKILNSNSDLLEEPPPVRREDLVLSENKQFDESLSLSRQLTSQPRKCPRLNLTASSDSVQKSFPVQTPENYNITNMPFGDLEYLTKSEDEQCDISSNLIYEDVIEPLVEVKIEPSD
ncbi:hypothetical protein GWI33_013726 [Rhynchophorus ferrugineus]|uniref:C2H2-type domain-containing protein n=1 Tax=Rhynchophorus ferrugineus TaxID=354439 RepID=A0A834I421_RHYFE|nr:hypothetical protein GWI33_013726 [Rhynchophorus ferrugineus]